MRDLSLLLLRLTFGGLMAINHGYPKLMKLLGDGPIKFGDPIGIGVETSLYLVVFAELVCAILIVIGLFTRFATIPLIITMFVAAFIVHWGDGFKEMEHAILFLVSYIVLLREGAGSYSLDDSMWRL
ncbi:MAG: DoxX family protein [Saprospiraceae bacterium]